MARGLGYDSAGGRAIAGAITAVMTGTAYATSAAMADSDGRLPGLRRQSRRDAAGHPQSPPRRARRERRLRSARHRAGRARYRQLPRRPPRRGGKKRLESGTCARRAARLPQRPGLGHRADRHDRPGDGLRHHRHRARLRPGEVQDAGGRRLLQDHQSDGAARARAPRLRRRDGRAHRGACGRPRHAEGRAGDQSRDARGTRLRCGDARARREGAADGLRHPLRLLALHLGRRLLPQGAGARRCSARRSAARRAGASRLLPQRHRRSERLRVRDDVDRKRA